MDILLQIASLFLYRVVSLLKLLLSVITLLILSANLTCSHAMIEKIKYRCFYSITTCYCILESLFKFSTRKSESTKESHPVYKCVNLIIRFIKRYLIIIVKLLFNCFEHFYLRIMHTFIGCKILTYY